MKKLYVIMISLLMISMLAGCGTGEDAAQEEYVKRASEPGMHEIYGISFPVQATYWAYMFEAEELGSGDEWIRLDINFWPEEPVLLPSIETKEMDGREIYLYDIGDGFGIMIPSADGKSYIEIRTDFVELPDRDKTEQFYRDLLDGIIVTEDEGNVVRTDYISVDGIRIPAEGLRPDSFAYGIADTEDPADYIDLQIYFSDEDYTKGTEQILAELGSNEDSSLAGSGPFENGGIKGGWYNWANEWFPEDCDSLPYYTHNILVPVDELRTMVTFGYSFDADVDDLSIYDAKIKALDEQIHAVSAE